MVHCTEQSGAYQSALHVHVPSPLDPSLHLPCPLHTRPSFAGHWISHVDPAIPGAQTQLVPTVDLVFFALQRRVQFLAPKPATHDAQLEPVKNPLTLSCTHVHLPSTGPHCPCPEHGVSRPPAQMMLHVVPAKPDMQLQTPVVELQVPLPLQ